MTREEQKRYRLFILKIVESIAIRKTHYRAKIPSYQTIIDALNSSNIKTSIGNKWTCKSLFRFLQYSGYKGLHGFLNQKRNDTERT